MHDIGLAMWFFLGMRVIANWSRNLDRPDNKPVDFDQTLKLTLPSPDQLSALLYQVSQYHGILRYRPSGTVLLTFRS